MFQSPYAGANSLQDYPELDTSLTTTLFFGLRLDSNTQLYFDPEIAGGRGFSGVTGIANFPNGEMPRVASATPTPYLARLYLTHDFGFGTATEPVSSGENQLGGERPATRYTVVVGRFTVTDFFDNNSYSHDPRTQFTGWGVMYNGAWDYPADTRGVGCTNSTPAAGPFVMPAPPNRKPPTACASTAGCCAIAATCSRAKFIFGRGPTKVPSAC
jgi:high affinity Mn2+ porin